MSVLIKDMEKPKSCYTVIDGESEYCPFVNTDDDCVLLLKKGTCEGTWEEQYSKCPLVELPEKHGRLIDGDKLKAKFPSFANSSSILVSGMRAAINHAPTVIGAEGSE